MTWTGVMWKAEMKQEPSRSSSGDRGQVGAFADMAFYESFYLLSLVTFLSG